VEGLQAGGVDYVTKPVVPTELIARVKVHLANAQLTRSAQLAMDVSGRYLLATDSKGRLRWCTQQAGRLLDVPVSRAGLPPEVTLWLQAKISPGRDPVPDTIAISAAPAGDAAQRPAQRIEFALIGQLAGDEYLLRIVELNTNQDVERLQSRVKLTKRETEVLLWLSRGKSNRDIAQILAVSYRTINKHLEQIYPKLGVETRTSAVAMAIRALEGT
jgi:DNA-binding CsgD family transcriptional regulator